MVIEYGGDIFQLAMDCDCEDYAYLLPEDGSVLDIATMVLLADAPNPELALVFMDYVLDPYVNGQIVNEIAYPTANQAAIEGGFVDESLLNDPLVFPDLANAENSWFLDYIGDADVLYNDAWDETLILIGK
jgi:spermidine/putrescine-binding protein